MNDLTTFKRFEYSFSKEEHLRTAYHENCDETLRMTPELKNKVETDVRAWLDDNGAEAIQIQFNLEPGSRTIMFTRAEAAFKTASNNWVIYHIAQSGFWPRLISSKPKLLIQHPPEMITMKNEIRCFNYGEDERRMSQLAEGLLKDKESEDLAEVAFKDEES